MKHTFGNNKDLTLVTGGQFDTVTVVMKGVISNAVTFSPKS